MRFIILSLLASISTLTLADPPKLKSGGQYEANLRTVGVPTDAGMVFNSGKTEKPAQVPAPVLPAIEQKEINKAKKS